LCIEKIILVLKVKLISYNVNGIRAALNKGLATWIQKESPDILCVQEIKADDSQIDNSLFTGLGYETFWFPAQKKGYSGTGILTRTKPIDYTKGIGVEKYDSEGRTITMDFENFTLINSYFPSGTTGDVRQDFKMEYLGDFLSYTNRLKKEKERIIVSGDFNICHKPIDINHPERHQKSSGFLPGEREWMDLFIESGFIDSFREFNREPNQYSWWSYRANSRAKNLGWRIDYNMASNSLKNNLRDAGILKEVFHSDHCPVKLEMEF
jgi:exodeoxyribonuclease III